MFETVVGVELQKSDKRAVCDTGRYKVATKSWKSGKAIQEQLLKRKRPISPLSSNKRDKEAEKDILRKKPGHRLSFDYSDSSDPMPPIRPNQISADTPLSTKEVSCQTSRTLFNCRPNKLSPENIASSRLVAPGSPGMSFAQDVGVCGEAQGKFSNCKKPSSCILREFRF